MFTDTPGLQQCRADNRVRERKRAGQCWSRFTVP